MIQHLRRAALLAASSLLIAAPAMADPPAPIGKQVSGLLRWEGGGQDGGSAHSAAPEASTGLNGPLRLGSRRGRFGDAPPGR